jgi:hypothetical protein
MGFIDMPPSHWAAKDVNDLVDVNLYGYGKFIESIPYNAFVTGYEAFDKIFIAATYQNEFNLGVSLIQSIENPIAVLHNGIEIGYSEIKQDDLDNTVVVLRKYVPQGSIIRIIALGKPDMYQYTDPEGGDYNPLGIPKGVIYSGTLPEKQLSFKSMEGGKYTSYDYIYDLNYELFTETATVKGVQMKRVPFISLISDLPSTEPKFNDIYFVNETQKYYKWDSSTSEWIEKTIPPENNLYTVSTDGKFITTYYMNNETVIINYLIGVKKPNGEGEERTYTKITESLYAESDSMIYTNRIFPNVFASMPQILTFLDRLRVNLLLKYTSLKNYSETVINKIYTSSAFQDIQTLSSEPWWWYYVKNLEDLKYHNGVYVLHYGLDGVIDDSFPRPSDAKLGIYDLNGKEKAVTRGETAYLINRFRKYFLEILG